ncbi:MAG TPA: family 43 glycosylhydrolase [Firmicutes bacterium]|nr:family 43 glycosylhydrolase [Bacillota bacterium]
MKFKKIISLLLASVLMITSLAACGGSGEESSTADNSSESSAEESSGESSAEDSSSESSAEESSGEESPTMSTINALSERVSVTAELGKAPKELDQMNPLISQRYSADPTSVEYNGRVYVYSTNDDQQYLTGSDENTYRDINTLNVFSSDDMVNWIDHGYIDVKAASPRITTSWAPSIVKRVEDDGLTHFYLFYAEDGWATGVLTATDPLGPWTDPLGRAVISPAYPEVEGYMVNCFDPGAYCDEDGTIYVSCGGGVVNTEAEPMSSAIVELDDDLNIVGHPHVINAPYFFEASELNKINGKYVYTYNSNWQPRDVPVEGYTPSPTCAMEYMISDSPTGPYTYKGYYFPNPGEAGFYWGNNHTHLQEFNGKWYLFYQSRMLEQANGIEKGFRCVMAEEMTISEDCTITPKKATKTGVEQVKTQNAFDKHRAATICSQAGIMTLAKEGAESGTTVVTDIQEGDWIRVKGVDFGDGASQFTATVKGEGIIDIRLDDINSATVGSVDFNSEEEVNVVNSIDTITGVHDVFFVFGGSDWEFDSWQFS